MVPTAPVRSALLALVACVAQIWLVAPGGSMLAATLTVTALVLVTLAARAPHVHHGDGAPYLSARGAAPGETCAIEADDPDTDARPRPRAPGRGLPVVLHA